MKKKDNGRKIYRTKEKNYYEKSTFEKFVSTVLTIFLIGGIGFLGYSTAEPLINFTRHTGDEPEPTTEDVIPPEETTTDEQPETETTVQPTTEAPTAPPVTMEAYGAYSLTVNDLENEKSLQTALEKIPKNQGIEYVEVPLKAKGGMIYYLSTVVTDSKLKEFQKLNLVKISEMIKSNGYTPSALVSTFNDNILPTINKETGYIRTDGSLWEDTALNNWISPFSQDSVDYLVSVVNEITSTGFDHIVCTDFVFPEFTANDLRNLDERLSINDRCVSLTSTANLLYNTSVANGATMFIEVSAADVLAQKADILQSMLLTANTIVLNINIDELGEGVSDGRNYYEFSGTPAEKVKKCLGFVSEFLYDFNVAVRVSGSSITEQDLISVRDTIIDFGYNSFVLG